MCTKEREMMSNQGKRGIAASEGGAAARKGAPHKRRTALWKEEREDREALTDVVRPRMKGPAL